MDFDNRIEFLVTECFAVEELGLISEDNLNHKNLFGAESGGLNYYRASMALLTIATTILFVSLLVVCLLSWIRSKTEDPKNKSGKLVLGKRRSVRTVQMKNSKLSTINEEIEDKKTFVNDINLRASYSSKPRSSHEKQSLQFIVSCERKATEEESAQGGSQTISQTTETIVNDTYKVTAVRKVQRIVYTARSGRMRTKFEKEMYLSAKGSYLPSHVPEFQTIRETEGGSLLGQYRKFSREHNAFSLATDARLAMRVYAIRMKLKGKSVLDKKNRENYELMSFNLH